jgi:hypothetical protein
MHDCNGNPLKPFDKVRAATKEELEAAGHKDPLAGFTGERVMLCGTTRSDCCNVQLAHEILPGAILLFGMEDGGRVEFSFRGPVGYATARTLVKVEA